MSCHDSCQTQGWNRYFDTVDGEIACLSDVIGENNAMLDLLRDPKPGEDDRRDLYRVTLYRKYADKIEQIKARLRPLVAHRQMQMLHALTHVAHRGGRLSTDVMRHSIWPLVAGPAYEHSVPDAAEAEAEDDEGNPYL